MYAISKIYICRLFYYFLIILIYIPHRKTCFPFLLLSVYLQYSATHSIYFFSPPLSTPLPPPLSFFHSFSHTHTLSLPLFHSFSLTHSLAFYFCLCSFYKRCKQMASTFSFLFPCWRFLLHFWDLFWYENGGIISFNIFRWEGNLHILSAARPFFYLHSFYLVIKL